MDLKLSVFLRASDTSCRLLSYTAAYCMLPVGRYKLPGISGIYSVDLATSGVARIWCDGDTKKFLSHIK